jgi:hypothetical protein
VGSFTLTKPWATPFFGKKRRPLVVRPELSWAIATDYFIQTEKFSLVLFSLFSLFWGAIRIQLTIKS